MAILRDRPYAQFNFLIDFGTGRADGPHAGFQECSSIQKISGLNKTRFAKGSGKPTASLRSCCKTRNTRLCRPGSYGARIIKHVSWPFNAKTTHVAIEELIIACERRNAHVVYSHLLRVAAAAESLS